MVFSIDQLARAGEHPVWIAYLGLSLLLGLGGAAGGWRTGRLLTDRLQGDQAGTAP
ncbi:hypothetical protein AHiyo4_31860 [Arthrobacter sp. Hiyo4]|nr:hypothetical protein AHiyo4_31860 [Arthrobacter sp. Hiyo4]